MGRLVQHPPAPVHHGTVLRGVAAVGLSGSMLQLPTRPLDEGPFGDLLGQARFQRLSGLLWQAVVDEALPVTEAQARQVEWQHVEALAGSLALEQLLLDTAQRLEGSGVPVRVLKGTAAAHLDYPEPGQRLFGDVDILVPGASFDAATDTLLEAGHIRLHPEPRRGFDRRFSKGTSFRTDAGLEIDLHRTFTMGPLGIRLDVASLWEEGESFELGGRTLHALSAEQRFVHACYHAVLGEVIPRLVPLRDIAQLALARSLDLDRVHQLVRASGGEAVVSRAVRLAWDSLEIADILAISAWAEAYRGGGRQAAELAVYGDGSSYARKSMASLRALPTYRDRAAFLYALAVPTSSYLQHRHAGRLDRWRTGVRQIRGAP